MTNASERQGRAMPLTSHQKVSPLKCRLSVATVASSYLSNCPGRRFLWPCSFPVALETQMNPGYQRLKRLVLSANVVRRTGHALLTDLCSWWWSSRTIVSGLSSDPGAQTDLLRLL